MICSFIRYDIGVNETACKSIKLTWYGINKNDLCGTYFARKKCHIYSQINNFVALITCRRRERESERRGEGLNVGGWYPSTIMAADALAVRYTGNDLIISMEINIKSSWVHTRRYTENTIVTRRGAARHGDS